jgi:hypothetical protein
VALVCFTNPLGEPVLVKPGDVSEVRHVVTGEYAPPAKTVIVLGNGHVQAVCEAFADVEEKLK